MEWSRAKTILILTFFILNGLLGYQLWVNQSDLAGAYFQKAEIRENMEQRLQGKNIRLEAEIPEGMPRLKEITGLLEIRNDVLSLMNNEPDLMETKNKQQPPEVEGIKHNELYEMDTVISDSGQLKYNQIYENRPMFEVNVELHIRNGKIYAYSQRYVKIIPNEEEMEEPKVISAYRAVGYLAERYLKEGSVITDIQLGYHGQAYEADTQVLAPKWRVTLKDGEIYYIHAVNGAVEQKE